MSAAIPAQPPVVPPPPSRAARVRRVVYYVVGLTFAGLAAWTISGKTDELSGAGSALLHLRWGFVVLAGAAEVGSYLAFSGALRRLLRAGGVDMALPAMTATTVAANAIQNTLPAGIVLATAYLFRQFRRAGADDILAGWVVVAIAVVSFAGLTVIAATGVIMALGSASNLDLVAVIVGLSATVVLLIVAWIQRAAWVLRGTSVLRLSQRLVRWPRQDPDETVRGWLTHLGAISPGRRDWAVSAVLATANWLLDLGCLTLAFLAVGAQVPWRGLFLAYGAGQLAALLPITPGGLGVVEGSLTVALVAFGGAEASAVASVLIYRIISFWLMLPIGWAAWGGIGVSTRRRSKRNVTGPRRTLGTLVPAGEDT